jgi:hypothetical protein
MTGNAKVRAFLAAYKLTGDITRAAKAVPIDRGLHYRWLKISDRYVKAFQAATEEFADVLEGEAIRRANEGILEAVFYQGQPCGAIRVYSDGLMQFLLRGMKPGKYSTRVSAEVSGPGGAPVEIRNAELAALDNDELAALKQLALKVALAAGNRARGEDSPATED